MVAKKRKSTMLLAKYGKLEHLESLAAGHVHFNPISKYRSDSTAYRGDRNEGVIPIDPTTMKIFDPDGNNILEKIPLPSSVRQSFVGDDSLLMFCASMITEKILQIDCNHYVFKDEYKNSISEFGDHVLLFHSAEFLNLMRKTQQNATPKFGFVSGKVMYRDLDDFSLDGD
ncbi:MAG: hypothetical protein GX587_08725, partial [Bacteroidales bacterium]|nr:hypothetical protein [Bacteroidales bacterium]